MESACLGTLRESANIAPIVSARFVTILQPPIPRLYTIAVLQISGKSRWNSTMYRSSALVRNERFPEGMQPVQSAPYSLTIAARMRLRVSKYFVKENRMFGHSLTESYAAFDRKSGCCHGQ